MLTEQRVKDLIDRIRYRRDWEFIVHPYENSFALQIIFTDEKGIAQASRRWSLPWHACESEVLHTALLAVLTAEEHEARERFLFDGRAVFGPNHSIEALIALADDVETRQAQEAAA